MSVIAKRTATVKKVVYCIFFSSHGPAIQVSVFRGISVTDKVYKNVVFKKLNKYFKIRRPKHGINAVHVSRFLSNGSQILSGSDDNSTCIWDIPTEKPIITYNEHKESGDTTISYRVAKKGRGRGGASGFRVVSAGRGKAGKTKGVAGGKVVKSKGGKSTRGKRKSRGERFDQDEVERLELLRRERKLKADDLIENLDEAGAKSFLRLAAERNPSLLLDIAAHLSAQSGDEPEEPEPNQPTEWPSWCTCHKCILMPTDRENVCCGMRPDLCSSTRPDYVRCGVTSKVSKDIVLTGGNTIKIWDGLAGGKLITSLTHHHKTVTCLGFCSNYQRLLSCGLDRHVKIYDVGTYQVVHTLDYPGAILSLGVSPDDSLLAVGTAEGLLSLQGRKSDEVVMVTKKKRPVSYRYGLRGKNYLPNKIKVRKSTPDVTFSVLQELIRRDGIRTAIAGREGSSLRSLVYFIVKNISNPRYISTLIDLANLILDMYQSQVGRSSDLDDVLSKQNVAVEHEMAYMKLLYKVMGSMDTLFPASHHTHLTNNMTQTGSHDQTQLALKPSLTATAS